MHKDRSIKEIGELSCDDRYKLARAKTKLLVSALISHHKIHANNRIIVYSDTLSKQIPRSHAANAFNSFQISSLHYEYIRLCSFWDSVDLDSFNILTVAALANDSGVKKLVYEDHFSHYENYDQSHANRWGQRARRRLNDGIREAEKFSNSDIHKSTRNFRDKLSHLLEQTHEEKKGAVAPPVYGDERKILGRTQTAIDRLHQSLNGTGFAWDSTKKMERRNAAALWYGVSIQVQR